MAFSETIEIKIFDGNPNGLIMCDVSISNCRAYKVSRNEIHQFAVREDSENTGVYFLFGRDISNNETVYVGEAERVCKRLKQHLRDDDDYWNDCIAIISTDNSLNKAHVKYLENTFYLLAKESGRANVNNVTIPTCPSLSEYDITKLEKFISHARLLVNTLGYKVFDSVEDTAVSINNNRIMFFITAARGANAKGMVVADGFAVLKESVAASSTTPSMTENLVRLRASLYERGIIDIQNVFTRDHVFTSPSLAASVVMGRNANGLTEWKTEDRKTIREVEEVG
jgi:hypothetical protein